MKKYENNDLLDFLLDNPMEMRIFLEEYEKLNFFTKWIIELRAYFS